MRRYVLVILALALLWAFPGCTNSDIRTPVSFYYCTNPVDYNTPEGVVSAEIREGEDFDQDQISLLNLYLQGPISDSYASPFPDNVTVAFYSFDAPTAQIQLSREFANLSGHDLTIACTCISMTVIELTKCDAVQISVTGTPLDGNDYIEMSMDDILFLDAYNAETTP